MATSLEKVLDIIGFVSQQCSYRQGILNVAKLHIINQDLTQQMPTYLNVL